MRGLPQYDSLFWWMWCGVTYEVVQMLLWITLSNTSARKRWQDARDTLKGTFKLPAKLQLPANFHSLPPQKRAVVALAPHEPNTLYRATARRWRSRSQNVVFRP